MKYNPFLIIFQFGTVVCAVCKRNFNLNHVKRHFSNTKECLLKYPKEAQNALLLKTEERKNFFKRNYQEEINVAQSFAQKQKERDAARAAMAKSVAKWKIDKEKKCRDTNLSSMNQLKRKIDGIDWKHVSKDFNNKLTNIKSEINELYEKIEKTIDDAAFAARDCQTVNTVSDAYCKIVGGQHIDRKRHMLDFVIQDKYKELEAKFKNLQKEIADE